MRKSDWTGATFWEWDQMFLAIPGINNGNYVLNCRRLYLIFIIGFRKVLQIYFLIPRNFAKIVIELISIIGCEILDLWGSEMRHNTGKSMDLLTEIIYFANSTMNLIIGYLCVNRVWIKVWEFSSFLQTSGVFQKVWAACTIKNLFKLK